MDQESSIEIISCPIYDDCFELENIKGLFLGYYLVSPAAGEIPHQYLKIHD